METFLKILGTIALIIIGIPLCILAIPFIIVVFKWLFGLIAGITFGGVMVILLIAIICYLIWG